MSINSKIRTCERIEIQILTLLSEHIGQRGNRYCNDELIGLLIIKFTLKHATEECDNFRNEICETTTKINRHDWSDCTYAHT